MDGLTVILTVRLTNGATLRLGGLIGATDGFHATNLKGEPLTFIFHDEIESIGYETYVKESV